MNNFHSLLTDIKKLIEKQLKPFVVKEVALDVAELKEDSQNYLFLDLLIS